MRLIRHISAGLYYYRTIVLLVFAISLFVFVPPRTMKGLEVPREGRALNQNFAVVFGEGYRINLYGMERFFPQDINKHVKIYEQLVADHLVQTGDVYVPEEISPEALQRVHCSAYLESLHDSAAIARYLDFPMAARVPIGVIDKALLSPFRHACGGTLLAARRAMEFGRAVNLGGGYHQAAPTCAGGFCLYADMPMAIRALQAEGRIDRVLIVDFDVHCGLGNAAAFVDEPSVFIFDMFAECGRAVCVKTNRLEVAVPVGAGDDVYLGLLDQHLGVAFEQAQPDLVLYQAGADVLAGEVEGGLSLTARGIARRDRRVLAEADRRGVPIVMLLGGGSGPQAWQVQYESIAGLIRDFSPPVLAEVSH